MKTSFKLDVSNNAVLVNSGRLVVIESAELGRGTSFNVTVITDCDRAGARFNVDANAVVKLADVTCTPKSRLKGGSPGGVGAQQGG